MKASTISSYTQHTDEKLLILLREHDIKAFEEIYQRYWSRLFMYACNILEDQSTCEDILQEIFTRLWHKRDHTEVMQLKPYLFQAVKFQVIKYLRRRKLSENHLNHFRQVSFANDTEQQINFKELEGAISEALEELPPRCREIFQLSRYEDLSHAQIAQKLNISTQTVKNQITTALQHLRARFDHIFSLVLILLTVQ